MALTPSAIRQRVAASITAALGTAARPWQQSAFHYGNFPPSKDPSTTQPRSFAVGVRDLQTAEPEGRQRRSVGAKATTEIRVRWCSPIRGDAQVADLDQALDDGDLLAAAVLGTNKDPELEIRMLGFAPSQTQADGTLYIGEAGFVVRHRYPLQ